MWSVCHKAILLSSLALVVAELEADDEFNDKELHRHKRSELPCAAKFRIVENHSACLPRVENNPGASEADKKLIVDTHNAKRSSANPSASNMLRMSWDDEVAMIAQKWADNCVLKHDSQRNIPGRFSVGQNIAMGARSWPETIELWHSEVKDFEYGNRQKMIDLFQKIGHYTQVMWAQTNKIGCGFSVCSGTNFHVCNYAPGGNVNSNYHLPYKNGTSCSDCHPDKCKDNLCECGLTCLNDTPMDLRNCTCTCLDNGFYKQPDCSLKCNDQDPDICQAGQAYSKYECNVVTKNCPVRCQLCPYAEDGYSGSLPPSKGTAQHCATISLWLLVLAPPVAGCIVLNFVHNLL